MYCNIFNPPFRKRGTDGAVTPNNKDIIKFVLLPKLREHEHRHNKQVHSCTVNALSLYAACHCLYPLSLVFCLCPHLSALRQHDLVDKVDDGRGRLFGVQLGKQVANVLCQAARLLGYKTKHPESSKKADVRKNKKEFTEITQIGIYFSCQ